MDLCAARRQRPRQTGRRRTLASAAGWRQRDRRIHTERVVRCRTSASRAAALRARSTRSACPYPGTARAWGRAVVARPGSTPGCARRARRRMGADGGGSTDRATARHGRGTELPGAAISNALSVSLGCAGLIRGVLFSALRMDAHGGTSPGRYGTLFPLTITALGVVYGDIGTSPLYAIRECFFGSHSVGPTHDNVLGVLSLVLYALLLVISVKYTCIVMRADNQGEGGILSLTALLPSRNGSPTVQNYSILVAFGIVGASLLCGEGMITPAVSIMSAIEGLQVATPVFSSWVVPISVVILVVLFVIQRHGTHSVGVLFGLVMVV